MANITIKMKDGTVREFRHEGRAGGSYSKRLYYETGFVVVEDEWQTRTAIPAADIAEVIETPHRYGW